MSSHTPARSPDGRTEAPPAACSLSLGNPHPYPQAEAKDFELRPGGIPSEEAHETEAGLVVNEDIPAEIATLGDVAWAAHGCRALE
ncbi:MAG: hypothetical protein IT170_06310 [Bryobacterales bacterium]|nr:hypothetical protein [Bryobacterales bacterium]